PALGETSPDGGQLANRFAANINPRTTSVMYSAQSGTPTPTTLGGIVPPPVFNRAEHYMADTLAESDTKMVGTSQDNQLYLTATARAVGDPTISQGSLIFAQNANGSQNGLWWVCEATHVIDTKTYSLDVALGRDSLGVTGTLQRFPQTASPVQ